MASKSKLASARANEKVQSSRLDKNLKSATGTQKSTKTKIITLNF